MTAMGCRFRLEGLGVLFFLAQFLLFCHLLVLPAEAAESVFTSTKEIGAEASRLSEEGKLFVKGPVDPYLAQTAAVLAAFGVSYVYDQDIRSDLAGIHNVSLSHAADWGSQIGDPLMHIGIVAAVYGVGAAVDAPRVQQLGQELGEALVLADGTSYVLKEAAGRGRPTVSSGNSHYKPFQFKNDYDSLPSIHSASSFAVAHVLASKTDSIPVKILCYAGAGFVSFSRLYQNKHWASDVVLGAAIGELAGNSVTRYYDLQSGKVAITPVSIDGIPSVALVGRF